LRRSLLFLESHVNYHPRFSAYKAGLSDFSNKDIVEQLSLYWLITYNTLIEDLEKFKLQYVIANNDTISLNHQQEIEDILNFCGIEIGDQIRGYLNQSTMTNDGVNSSVDTNRKSKEYYLDRVRQLDHGLKNRIEAIIRNELVTETIRPTLDLRG
jgi:hypothetical protein